MKLLEFFEESNGTLSSMRLMSFMCVATGLFIAINGTLHGQVIPTDTLITLLTVGFGGKIAQKGLEEKTPVAP